VPRLPGSGTLSLVRFVTVRLKWVRSDEPALSAGERSSWRRAKFRRNIRTGPQDRTALPKAGAQAQPERLIPRGSDPHPLQRIGAGPARRAKRILIPASSAVKNPFAQALRSKFLIVKRIRSSRPVAEISPERGKIEIEINEGAPLS